MLHRLIGRALPIQAAPLPAFLHQGRGSEADRTPHTPISSPVGLPGNKCPSPCYLSGAPVRGNLAGELPENPI